MYDVYSFTTDQVLIEDRYYWNEFLNQLNRLINVSPNQLLLEFHEDFNFYIIGKYLTSCIQAYCSANISEKEKYNLYRVLTNLVNGLKVSQDNGQLKRGFLTIEPEENLRFLHSISETIHGLTQVYHVLGYQPAYNVASTLGDLVYQRIKKYDLNEYERLRIPNLSAKSSSIEGFYWKIFVYHSMNDCMSKLFQITKKSEHMMVASQFSLEKSLAAVLEKTNTTVVQSNGNGLKSTMEYLIPFYLKVLLIYNTINRIVYDSKYTYASEYLLYVKQFWEKVTKEKEIISFPLLKLARKLYMTTGDVTYLAYVESMFHKMISQETYECNHVMGVLKEFSKCVYFHCADVLYINMFIDSTITWEEMNVYLMQKTTVKPTRVTQITVRTLEGKYTDVKLFIRIPTWSNKQMKIHINQQEYKFEKMFGFAYIAAVRNQDEITIEL